MKASVNTWALVKVNFKHLYQRRILWLLYPVLFLFLIVFVHVFAKPQLGQGLYIWPAVILFGLGCLVGTMVAEIRSRPMAFCLPRHRRASWWVLMIAGFILVAISTLFLLHWPAGPPVYRPLFLLAFLSLNALAFWWGVAVCSAWGWWPIGLPIIIVACALFDMNKLLEVLMANVYGGLVMIALCGVGTFSLMRRFCSRELVRNLCVKSWASFFDCTNPRRMKTITQQRRQERRQAKNSELEEHVNRWFCQKMQQQTKDLHRFKWAMLYWIVGRLIMGWKGLLGLGLFLTLYAGYWPSGGGDYFFVFMLCFAFSRLGMEPLHKSSLLRTDSRQNRFYEGIVGSLVSQVCGVVLLLTSSLVSWGLSYVMPILTIRDFTLTFHVIPWMLCVLPVLIMPLGNLSCLFMNRLMILMVAAFWFPLAQMAKYLVNGQGQTLLWVGGATAFSWILYLLGSYWHFFKRDLK